MAGTVVIAGAGHGAGQVVASLKQHKFDGRIVLIGDEPYLPYQRPPLSKKFLAGELAPERLYFKPASYYDDPQVEVLLETRVADIDRAARTVRTDGDQEISYDKLVLALGSRVREVPVEGADLPGIHYLRSIADVEAIRKDMSNSKNVVIVGAGFMGLSAALHLAVAGARVGVFEAARAGWGRGTRTGR